MLVLKGLTDQQLKVDMLTLDASISSCEGQFLQEAMLLEEVSRESLDLKMWRKCERCARQRLTVRQPSPRLERLCEKSI